MNEELTTMLEDEIKAEFQDLGQLTPTSKEQSIAINNVIKLYRLRLEEEKVLSDAVKEMQDHELADKKQGEEALSRTLQRRLDEKKLALEEKRLESENERSQTDKAKETKETIINWCIRAGELLLPLMFYAKWMKRGFEFERDGTFTSTTFRGLFNQFKPTKR